MHSAVSQLTCIVTGVLLILNAYSSNLSHLLWSHYPLASNRWHGFPGFTSPLVAQNINLTWRWLCLVFFLRQSLKPCLYDSDRERGIGRLERCGKPASPLTSNEAALFIRRRRKKKLALFMKRIIHFQQMIRCKGVLLRKDWSTCW